MALTPNDRLILLGILIAVMTVVVFYELRVIRRKSKEARFSSQKKDEAYNDILTTRSVANSLKNQGRDIGNATYYLDRARRAMDRGDYEECDTLCTKARNELTNPSSKAKSLAQTPGGMDKGDELQQVAENILSEGMPSTGPDSYKGTKLSTGSEGNYLGAKFEISAAKGDISRAAKSGTDVTRAEKFVSQADAEFASGNYDRALAFASRARRAASGASSEEAIQLGPEEETVKTEGSSEPEVYDIEEEKTPSGLRCASCGSVIDPTDRFCPNCGTSTSKDKICKSCGAVAKSSDIFCRKCGSRI